MPATTRIVLADDHGMIRRTIAHWLETEVGFKVVADVGDADSAIDACIEHRPDILVMDIDMPGRLCFDAARTIRSRVASVRIIFLSAFTQDRYIEDALSVEASGYLTKRSTPDELVSAVRTIANGGVWFSPEIQDRIVVDNKGVRLGSPRTRVSTLSPREVEVLRYIARGMSKKDIARTMHISVKTVDNHSTSLMAKLDLHDRVDVARFAIREGLAQL